MFAVKRWLAIHISLRNPALKYYGASRARSRAQRRTLPRRTRGISPHTRYSGCTIHQAHSRGICGRRVEYVPGYIRTYVGREYRRRYSPREAVATSLSVRPARMTSFLPPTTSRSPLHACGCTNFPPTSHRIRNAFTTLNAG